MFHTKVATWAITTQNVEKATVVLRLTIMLQATISMFIINSLPREMKLRVMMGV